MKQLGGLKRTRMNALRDAEDRKRKRLAALKSILQVYLEFDHGSSVPTNADEAAVALRARLGKLLCGTRGTRRPKGRAKLVKAVADATGGRAWSMAQMALISTSCDELAGAYADLAACRAEVRGLINDERAAIDEQRFELLDAQAAAAHEEGDGAADDAAPLAEGGGNTEPVITIAMQLVDLGLLTAEIDADVGLLAASPSDDLHDSTLDYSRKFGAQLHTEAVGALTELSPTGHRARPSSAAKLRLMGRLVMDGSDAMDDVELDILHEEAADNRRVALQEEVDLLAALFHSGGDAVADAEPNLGEGEAEMARRASGLAAALRAMLKRMAQRTAETRALDERLAAARQSAAESAAAAEAEAEAAWADGRAARPREPSLLAAGEWCTVCVRPADGAPFSWGGGSTTGVEQQRHVPLLGHGRERGPCVPVPTPLVGLANIAVREVAAGTMHVLILGMDGGVWSCGVARFGALGHPDAADRATPTRIKALADVPAQQVAAGHYHSLVLGADGQVLSFGWGAGGRLGLGDDTSRAEPTSVSALAQGVLQVSAGGMHSLAVGLRGELYSWGLRSFGRLGLGDDGMMDGSQLVPARVKMPRGVRVVHASAGGCHSLAVSDSGSLLSFGCGGHGRLGHGDSVDRMEPTRVTAIPQSTAIRHAAAGLAHSVVTTHAGGVLTFGSNFQVRHLPTYLSLLLTPSQTCLGCNVCRAARGIRTTKRMCSSPRRSRRSPASRWRRWRRAASTHSCASRAVSFARLGAMSLGNLGRGWGGVRRGAAQRNRWRSSCLCD